MSNYMDEDDAAEFRDVPDEVEGNEAPNIIAEMQPQARRQQALPPRSTYPPNVPQPAPTQPVEEYEEQQEETEDYTDVLNDARLRLEQGKLYELVMNGNLFGDNDCDPKAVKNVEKEIRNFAKERMEIMLGMRQETPKEAPMSLDNFPFNALEVEALKALASAATQGASSDAPPFTGVTVPRKNTLNPISVRSSKPKAQIAPPKQISPKPLAKTPTAPVKRAKPNETVQRILAEEGVTLEQVNEVFDPNQKYMTAEELAYLTPEQFAERNRQIALRTGKTAAARNAIPMPTQDQLDGMYNARAQQATANPQMQMIMNLLNNKK